MTRGVSIVALVIGLVLGVAMTMGARLPVEHTATVTQAYPVSVETLWTAVTDFRGYSLWRSGVDAVERLPGMDGAVAWRETGRAGELTLSIEESISPDRFVTRIMADDTFGGTWTFLLKEDGTGSRLTITEDGRVHNTFLRFLGHYVSGYDGAIRTFLSDLEVYLREMVPA